jgi:hypothetical protein
MVEAPRRPHRLARPRGCGAASRHLEPRVDDATDTPEPVRPRRDAAGRDRGKWLRRHRGRREAAPGGDPRSRSTSPRSASAARGWDNTYPRCELAVASCPYCFSFKPGDWSRTHARQPELQKYLEATVDEFGLRPHLQLGVAVEGPGGTPTTPGACGSPTAAPTSATCSSARSGSSTSRATRAGPAWPSSRHDREHVDHRGAGARQDNPVPRGSTRLDSVQQRPTALGSRRELPDTSACTH